MKIEVDRMEAFVEIRGAPENNLKDVSLRVPERKIAIEHLSLAVIVD